MIVLNSVITRDVVISTLIDDVERQTNEAYIQHNIFDSLLFQYTHTKSTDSTWYKTNTGLLLYRYEV